MLPLGGELFFSFCTQISGMKWKVCAYKQGAGCPGTGVGALDLHRDIVFLESLSVSVVREECQTHPNTF